MKVFADSPVMTRMKRVGPVLAILLLAALSRPSADASAGLAVGSSQRGAEVAVNPADAGDRRTLRPAESGDDALGTQSGDLPGAQAQLPQHLVRVLAKDRWREAGGELLPGEADRVGRQPHLARLL